MKERKGRGKTWHRKEKMAKTAKRKDGGEKRTGVVHRKKRGKRMAEKMEESWKKRTVWAVGNRVRALKRRERVAAQKTGSAGSVQVLKCHKEVKWRSEGKS